MNNINDCKGCKYQSRIGWSGIGFCKHPHKMDVPQRVETFRKCEFYKITL